MDNQTLYASNPYRNQEYKESGWQKFLSSLGFRTQADAWKENMSVQAAEYDAAITQKLRDEEYNNPSAQVERMKAAGLNPDLNGGQSIDPGSAASMPEDPSTPMQATGDEQGLIDFANGVLGCFTSAFGLVNSIQGIQRNHLNNVFQSLENEGTFQEFARGMFPYFLPESPEPDILEDGTAESWQYQALQRAKMFAGKMPKKMQDKFLTSVQSYWNSAPGSADAYKAWKDRVSQRKGYFSDSSYFYDESDDVLKIISEELQSVNEEIYKAQQDAAKTGAEAETSENQNSKTYFDELDSGLQARSENAANEVSRQNSNMVGIMRSHLESMIKKLDSLSNEKGIKGGLASAAMALLSVFQLYISSQGMPSFSRSTSSSSGPKGVTQSQSSSLSF